MDLHLYGVVFHLSFSASCSRIRCADIRHLELASARLCSLGNHLGAWDLVGFPYHNPALLQTPRPPAKVASGQAAACPGSPCTSMYLDQTQP